MTDHTLDSTLLHLLRSRMVDDYPSQIGECLDVTTDEDMWWRPDEKSNALGTIMLHLIGSNRLYVGHGVGARAGEGGRAAGGLRLRLIGSNRWYVGYGVGARAVERDRAAEFTARGNPGRDVVVGAWN